MKLRFGQVVSRAYDFFRQIPILSSQPDFQFPPMLKPTPLLALWLLLLFTAAAGQVINHRLSASVIDADNGEPLSKVSVRTRDNTRGTASDASGHFVLE